MKKIYKITLFLIVLLLSNAAFSQYNLLFVGDPISHDSLLIPYLESEGYYVTGITDDDFAAGYATADAYSGFDAIFISEIVGSGDVVNYKNAGFPIPCVTTEGYVTRNERWDFITDNDVQFKQASGAEITDDIKTLVITDGDHYITQGYGIGAEVDWTTAPIDNLGVTGSKLDENIVGVLKLGVYKDASMADFPTLWAIPDGSIVASSGTTIPVNIVIFGAIAPGLAEFATEDFNNIVKRSLEWVTGNEQMVNINENVIRLNTKVFPNPALGLATVTFIGNATSVVLSDVTGQKVTEFIPEGNKVTFETSNLAAGVYFVTVENETIKLIIK